MVPITKHYSSMIEILSSCFVVESSDELDRSIMVERLNPSSLMRTLSNDYSLDTHDSKCIGTFPLLVQWCA